MQTIVTDTATIASIIEEAVRAAVENQLPALVQEATRPPYLGRDEVKAWTGWSDRTLQHLRDTRQIPFVQHGRKVVYPTHGVVSFLQQHTVAARKERGVC